MGILRRLPPKTRNSDSVVRLAAVVCTDSSDLRTRLESVLQVISFDSIVDGW
jgi:hypothetical protein